MLTGVAPGSTVEPIITVGDTMPGGYRFESIPDGIALKARGNGRLDVYVNHETSTVPFPYNANAAAEANQNDFDNAQLSRLALHQHSGGVLNAKMVIDEQLQLPALLLELPRHRRRGLRPRAPLHERGGHRLRLPDGNRLAGAASEPPAEQAGSWSPTT